ncbi:MAG: hypothetical protein RIT15_265 [Pseudomonadota bacterium]|jgi:methyl-accepting chemotaxis protein
MIDASNAIVKLASDIGAIFNVASASDFGTGIYDSISKINDSICKVAHRAEEISQLAMKTSAKISDISVLADQLAPVVKAIKQLTQTLASRKAINPLIPDVLISLANKAVHDADEASALVAIALQSAIAAEIHV